jgi:hypothetical protein
VRLSAIILARVLAYVETFDLVPRGNVFLPDITRALIERCSFQKFPQSPDQFDEQKGVEFLEGKWRGIVIQKFTIFNSLLTIETRAGTDESKRILEEILEWGAGKFKLNYAPGSIKHFAYVSAVSFHSEAPLLSPTAAISNLAEKTSRAVSEIWGEPIQYYGLNIGVGHDPLARKYGMASFYITRRAEAKFSENKYYSEAPLPTDSHIQLLEEYERNVSMPIEMQIRQMK